MAEKKDVFKNWIEDQVVFNRISIDTMGFALEKKNLKKMEKNITKKIVELQSMAAFFGFSDLNECLRDYSLPSYPQMKSKFAHIYSLLEADVGQFIEYLYEDGFSTDELDDMEEKQSINTVVKKHDAWIDYLFDQEDEEEKEEFLFTISNNFFEFCFHPKTFPKFKKMLADSEYHPVLRFIYSVMWTNLAEVGWQHWHGDCLVDLRKEADTGKEVVYVAGGTDIYQLIKHGIYNIRVIDPLLPTQPKYYSQNWDWFVNGELGERAAVPCDGKTLTMERADYKEFDNSFTVKLATKKKKTIQQSETTWKLYDENNKQIGRIVFERRLTNQEDFNLSKDQTMLISFNELYFVAAPPDSDGWGIVPKQFDDDIKIYIKQLEKPVTKTIVCNFRHEIFQDDFAFIELGTCIN